MVTKKVKAIDLVLDWNLCPRHEAESLDSTNLKRMKDALVAGIKLPPVVINEKDNRIVDGFHRVKAHLSVYGDEATIIAEIRNFQSEADMFKESARLNNQHGLPLSPRDRAYVINKARKFKIPMPAIAEALGLDPKEAKDFLEKRSAKSQSGETIILSGGSRNLAGKVLTPNQETYVKACPGTSAQLYARLLLNALKAEAVIFNDKVIESLSELRGEIDKILAEVA